MAELINDAGITVIIVFVAAIFVLLGLNVVFQFYRNETFARLEGSFGKPLEFQSPDDEPRSFTQYGFKNSLLGVLLLYSWVALFLAGYAWMVLFCWLSYSPQFFAPGFGLTIFGGWNGLLAPWLVIFTFVHIIGMVLILSWDAMRTRFMMPVAFMGDASHVMIEEEVSFMTDDALADPDVIGRLKSRAMKIKGRFNRAKCRTVLPVKVEKDGTRRIEYTCVRYVYAEEDDSFHPTGLVKFTAAQVHQTFQNGGLAWEEAKETMRNCGKNEINVYVPGIAESLIKEFADFTYVFNSIGTWAYMVYSSWNIGIFWLLLTLGSGMFRSLFIVRPNQKKIHELAQLHTECEVLRGGEWQTIQASDMVLGDIIRVDDNSAKLPCDGVVIEGSLVVNESMLTGEPMPIQKMAVENSANASITKKNTAYAGTACLQSTGPKDGKAVMIATAVGALTTRGQLVRMVLFPTSVRFKYNDQLPKVYMIICVYMVILCAIYVSPLMDLKSWIATYLMVLCTIAMCLSPMLPVSMVMGQSVTARRLQAKHKIGCLQPGRIPIAGKISTMVFDKTGTITKDGMDFDAVLPVDGSLFGAQVRFNIDDDGKAAAQNMEIVRTQVPHGFRHALASCHTVTTMRDGTLVGNAVEVSMVKTVGWKIGENTISSPSGDEKLEVVKKLDFDHCRMTSGVVVRSVQTGDLEVYMKGSYEKIQSISVPASVPADYDPRTQQCAKDGYYVLGIATKSLPRELSAQQLADMTRDSLEAGLSICGLLLFRNEMKKDSAKAIDDLRRGAIRSVICTGDNALTGISIGKQCGIVSESRGVLLGELSPDTGRIVWRDPDGATPIACDPPSAAFADWQLAVTQGAWRHLHGHPNELEAIWTRLVVFARMKPEDKINVVKYFQSRNLVVGMCGDGGNDCGGLRAAHAGLALSDAEASMVSPFATGRDGKSLITVVDLIREGRACLATNMATFQYFMVYAFTLTTIRTILAIYAALSLGEYVWLTLDVGIGMIMVWTMTQSEPTKTLCNYRPTATLLGPRTLMSIVFPYLSSMLTLVITWVMLWSQTWYQKLNPLSDIHLLPSLWMLRGDNYDSAIGMECLMLTLVNTAYVNTYGGPFRQNILRNIGLNVVYALFLFGLFFLMLSNSNQFNCLYRVNCGTGQSLEARDLVVFAAFSAGGVGGCFLGPQVSVWQEQMTRYGFDGSTAKGWWLPTTPTCEPPASATMVVNGSSSSVATATAPVDSELISQFGCVGPNNCFEPGFKWQLAAVFAAFMVVNHLFVKVVLHGPVATSLRKRQQKGDRMMYTAADETASNAGQSDSSYSSEGASDEDLVPHNNGVSGGSRLAQES